MEPLPPALADALRARALVVFCGAGVSTAPPSCLPDWRAFNTLVLDEARASALAVLPELGPETREALEALSLEALPVVAFSETLVRTFAGDTWFAVLRVLDGERPNANHLALAELARRRVLRAVVSTNFDTLIERAFREHGVALSVYEKAGDYDVASGACALYKIHGSAKDAASLVDTVTQKLHGLPDEVRATVAALASEAHFLFLGFSGADLAFSHDYLGIGEAVSRGRGVTWLLAPARPVPEEVAAVVAAAGEDGAVVRGMLPGFLGHLGLEVEEPEAAAADAQAQADARARTAVSEWLRAPGVGALTCAVYLTRLLSLTGRVVHAQALRATIAPVVDDGDRVRARALLHALAVDAIRDGALAFADACLRRELALATDAGDHRALAVASLQRAVCARLAGRLDDARAALDAAVEHGEAEMLADVVASIEVEYANLAHAAGAHRDDVLARLEIGRRYALRRGAGDVLLEIELAAAEAYVELAEYDCALDALERAGRYARVSADFRGDLRRRAVLAEIAVRRGDPAGCLAELEALVERALARGDRGLADRLRWGMCRLLDWYPAGREQVLGAFDALVESASPAATVPRRETLRQLRAEAAAGRVAKPAFIAAQDGDEPTARRGIAVCEYLAPDPTAAVGAEDLPVVFSALRMLYSDPVRSPRRLLDVATGELRSAERVGDALRRADALEWIAVAHDLAGEPDEADPAFDQAIAASVASGDRTGETRNRWNLAKALLRRGEPERALVEARRARALAEELGNAPAAVAIELTVAKAERALEPDGVAAPPPRQRPVIDGPEDEAPPELLGALALAEWAEGSRAAARAHCAAALAGYTARGDRLGVSKCLNNMAEFALDENDFDEAASLTRRALNLRMILGDVDGQLLTLANLAEIEMHRHEPRAAAEAAERALVLAEDRLDARPAFTVARTLVAARLALGDGTGAAEAARLCLEIGTRQHAPELAELRAELEAVAFPKPATPTAAEPGSLLDDDLAEANRLARLGDVDATTRAVETARASYDLGTRELGWLEGIRAMALQNGQRYEEAVEAYGAAAELLVQAGDLEQASTALQQRAVSLRLLGRLEESEAAFRAALAQAPSEATREFVTISLANTLNARYAEQEDPAPALLSDVRELLSPIAEGSNLVEHRGGALVGLSVADQLEGDLEAALDHGHAGVESLRRVNSAQLDDAESMLRGLEEHVSAGGA